MKNHLLGVELLHKAKGRQTDRYLNEHINYVNTYMYTLDSIHIPTNTISRNYFVAVLFNDTGTCSIKPMDDSK